MDWHPIQVGVVILLVASCKGNSDTIRLDGPQFLQKLTPLQLSESHNVGVALKYKEILNLLSIFQFLCFLLGKQSSDIVTMKMIVQPSGLIKTKRSPILFYILQSPILNIDIAPTIVELAGGKAPESMDGRSILPLLVRYQCLRIVQLKIARSSVCRKKNVSTNLIIHVTWSVVLKTEMRFYGSALSIEPEILGAKSNGKYLCGRKNSLGHPVFLQHGTV